MTEHFLSAPYMFNNNSRVKNKDGVYFFEEDVIVTRNIFNNDTFIRCRVNYKNDGIGYVILPYDEQLNKISDRNYFLKINNNKISLSLNSAFSNIILVEKAIKIKEDEDMLLDFYFKKNKLILKIDDKELFKREIPKVKEYKIGLYSNKGNTIKNIDIKVPSPMKWNTNMKNTAGGLMKFIENGFVLTGCKRIAEIEQNHISLEKGYNYLTYESSNNSDIIPYVFIQGDKRVDDEQKNILEKVGKNKYKFYVDEGQKIVLKFRGKIGMVKNISISMNFDDSFSSTEDSNYSPGSSLHIITKDMKTIYIRGIVKKIPSKEKDYHIFSNKKESINYNAYKEFIKKELVYIIDVSDKEYKIKLYEPVKEKNYNPIKDYKDKKSIKEFKIKNISHFLSTFYNIDAIINRMVYILNNEKEDMVDVIKDKTNVYYVSSESIAPIIVEVDKESIDLSGSFRKKDNRYIFTNIQRELHKSKRVIYLKKPISRQDDVLKLYLIDKKDIDIKKLYHIKDVDNIDLLTKNYKLVSEADLEVDKVENKVIIPDYYNYEYVVVDYLKENSYSVNKVKNTNLYEVEVSTTDGELIEIFFEDRSYKSFEAGKMSTNILAKEKKYIALNKFKLKEGKESEDI